MTDIIDTINELELDHKCGHCHRDWHTRRLTQRVAAMFDSNWIDPYFFAGEDKSPVVCEGSDFIGPQPPPPPLALPLALPLTQSPTSDGWHWIGTLLDDEPVHSHIHTGFGFANSVTLMDGLYKTVQSFSVSFSAPLNEWWPEPIVAHTWLLDEEPAECPDVKVEFGPDNWLPAKKPVHLPMHVQHMVHNKWADITAPEIHAPKSPGIDYDQLAEKFNSPTKYPTAKVKK